MAPTVRRFVRWYFSERRSSGVDVVFYYFSNRCAKKLTKPQFNPSLRKSQRVHEARHHLQRHHSSCCRSIHNRALSCHSAFYYALCVCASVRVCVCKCLSGPSVCSWFNSSVFSLSAWLTEPAENRVWTVVVLNEPVSTSSTTARRRRRFTYHNHTTNTWLSTGLGV